MATGVIGLRAVNNWEQVVGLRLRQALAASIQIIGRTGYEACKHAIILMAQSARAITKKAPKNRVIEYDPQLGPFVRTFNKGRETGKIFKWAFNSTSASLKGTWEKARLIANTGLAKRSLMWGLAKLGKPAGSKPIPGVAYLNEILGEKKCGIILTNRLSYVQKAMPPGWELIVQEKAGNKIMRQAAMKLKRKWQSEVRRGTSTVITGLATAFKRAA
jgi:hypothetical protein